MRKTGGPHFPSPWRAAWAPGLAAATAAVYLPILRNGFVNWDDPANIVHNPLLGRFDAAGLSWAFTTTLGGHFQPLAWLSLSLDKALWGLNPIGFHATSLGLHAAAAAALFVFLRECLGDDSASDVPAALATVLFAWHPLRVESVAWATERRDQLSLLFMLLSAILYRRAVVKNSARPALGPALAAFVAAMLSKVFSAVFPALLLALDLGLLRRKLPLRRLVEEKAWFWTAAATGFALTLRAQITTGIAPSTQVVGWGDRLAIAAWTPGWTAWKTFLPLDLSPFVYVDWRAEPARFWSMAALTAALAAALFAFRRRPGVLSAGAAWLIALSPALGLVRSGGQSSADRYALIPSAALSVAAALLLRRADRRARATAFAAALILGAATFRQTSVWHDSVTLWSRAAAQSTDTLVVNNLISALNEAGRADEARALAASVRYAPDSPPAWAEEADARARGGDWAGAEALYRRAEDAAPLVPDFRLRRGLALLQLGRDPDAAAEFETAVRIQPERADGWHLLALTSARTGRFERAEEAVARALTLDPARADSRQLQERLRSRVKDASGRKPAAR